MSCPCPSGYTPTIDSDDCIYTVTAATSGGTYFYTATTGSQNASYCNLGVIFYEDVTNLSFPITNSGTTTSAYTENGTLLFNTEFLVDNSGRILNIQAGGQGGGYSGCFGGISSYYGPPLIQNSLWGSSASVPPYNGRLNNAGIWAGIPPSPVGEWIGFSYCLDIPTSGTYFIGFAADDRVRVKINGILIYETSSISYCTSIPQTLNTNTWTVLPYTLNSGLNIIEMEGLNIGLDAAFAAEIYSGSVSTLSGYTTTIQLTADTLFSTFDFIGQDIPLSNSGYTCPSGYALYNCSGTPYCIQIDRQPIVNYCVNDTGLGYDDYFKYGGIHNSEPYWSGETNGYVIYYTTGGTWCLSSVLDGTCLLEGPKPCNSVCPDLCDTYVFSGACPTPTPSPTTNCAVLDFTAIFDCEVTPTPTVTPTISTTPTPTPTPSTSPLCSLINIDVTITGYTPTPTATPSPTPTLTPQITRPCSIIGNVTYATLDNEIICPITRKFIDCSNGQLYFTDSYVPTPSGDTLTPLLLFKANVDGESKCIVYVGIDLTHSSMNVIELVDGPLGDLNIIADCSPCTPDLPPSPTPSPTLTPTLTPTPTPSTSPAIGFYTYKLCSSDTYLIQSVVGPTSSVGAIFRTDPSVSGECWEFISYTVGYPTLPPGSSYSYITYNYFPTSGIVYFVNCENCIFVVDGQSSPIES